MSMRREDAQTDAGTATVEMVGLLPLIILVAAAAFQGAAFLWAATSADEAVRQGARAESLGRNGCAAARDNLPPTITITSCTSSGGALGSGNDIEMVVDVPMIAAALPLVPDVQITRAARLP